MQLLLMRHGIAEDHGPDGTDDARRLTDKGVRKTRKAAAGLARFADAPDVILASPKTRTRQTADIVAKAFDMEPEIEDVLGENDAKSICDWLTDLDHDRVMLIGHEPSFSQLVATLCSGAPSDYIDMKKAGCACLDVNTDKARGELQWLAPPKMLIAMGE